MVCQPGEEPFLAVARALAPDLSDDAEEMRRLLAFHDPDMALAVAARWRGRWDEALLVVDQFEELFTLNPEPVRERFAELLRRLVDAAGVHVVLVLRDDFLLECHRHRRSRRSSAISPRSGRRPAEELRRALIEPAARRLSASRTRRWSTRWWGRWRGSGARCRCWRSRCRGCGSCGTGSGGC